MLVVLIDAIDSTSQGISKLLVQLAQQTIQAAAAKCPAEHCFAVQPALFLPLQILLLWH